jgi:hypothetical protein
MGKLLKKLNKPKYQLTCTPLHQNAGVGKVKNIA